jgi:hypothetical protein
MLSRSPTSTVNTETSLGKEGLIVNTLLLITLVSSAQCVQIVFFWVVRTYSLGGGHQRFGGIRNLLKDSH